MASLGNLIVNIGVRTGAFEKGLRKTSRRIDRFNRDMGQTIGRVARFGAALAATAAVGMSYMVKRNMDTIDSLTKLSRQLGIATDRLAGLEHAADITGVSTGLLHKSLEQLQRRIGEVAVSGTGTAVQGLERLGIAIDEIAGRDIYSQLLMVSDAMEGIEDAGERAYVAYQLFGRSGIQMTRLLGADINALVADAERLGLAFDKKAGRSIESANDALTRMRAVFRGIARQVTIHVAPIVEAVADEIAEWGSEKLKADILNLFKSMGIGANGVYVETLRLQRAVVKLHLAWSEMEATLWSVSAWIEENSTWFFRDDKGQKALAEAEERVEKLAKKYVELDLAMAAAIARQPHIGDDWAIPSGGDAGAGGPSGDIERLQAFLEKLEQTTAQLQPGFNRLRHEFEQIADTTDEWSETFGIIEDKLKEIERLERRQELKGRIESMLDGIKTPLERLKELGAELGEAIKLGLLDASQAMRILTSRAEGLFETTSLPQLAGAGMSTINTRYIDPAGMAQNRQEIQIWRRIQESNEKVSENTKRLLTAFENSWN